MGKGRGELKKALFYLPIPSHFSPQTLKWELAKQTIDRLLSSSACKFIFFQYAASAKTRRDLNKDFTRMGSFCITIWAQCFTEIQSIGCYNYCDV